MAVRVWVYRLIMAKFECPHCSQRIDAPEELAGTNAECPACGGAITVPNIDPVKPSQPSLKVAVDSPVDEQAPERTPSQHSQGVVKIKLGASLAALVLFALPWLDIQCSQKSMATQSGIQMIYGGGSPAHDIKGDEGASPAMQQDGESMGYAPLVAAALLAVIFAVVFSFRAIFKNGEDGTAEKWATILPAVALALLVIQLIIGIPVEGKISDAMSELNNVESTGDGFEDLGKSMAGAVMMGVSIEKTTAFYLELLALGIPTLFLANGFIDKHKKPS